MTLEDFFTLTEMKDGFATPSRVEELLCVMKKEKDFVVKNVSDATRQWTAVASTIAATENKECLDLFIRLDGLWFLDKWLKDALGLGSDTSESFVEESITAMLRALEKLHIDTGTSISTGICITVKNLLRHNSSRVQDIARVLFDSWKGGKASDPAHHNIDVSGASKTIGSMDGAKVTTENGQPESLAVDVSVIEGSTDRRNDEADPATVKNLIRNSSLEVLHQERGSDSGPGNLSDDTHSHRSGESAGNADTSDNQVNPPLASKFPQQINSTVDKKLPISTEGGTACSETLSLVVSKNEVSDSQNLNDPSSLAHQKSDGMDSATGKVERAATSCGSSLKVVEVAMLDDHAENKAGDRKIEQPKATPLTGLETPEPDSKDDKSNSSSKSHDGHEYREVAEPDELDTIISRLGKAASGDEDKKHSQEEGEGLRSGSKSSRKRQCKSAKPNASYDRASDLEFDYGIIDPLEVARNIAQEVEREVVDHRELSYSSSEELSEAGNDQPSIPDSNVKHDVTDVNLVTEASCGSDHSTGAGSEEKRCMEPERGIPEIESSQVTVAQEVEPKMEKSLCGFDLNQEFSSDDMEHPVDSISTPSVVSASRAAAAPGLPVAPLKFEGTLGWKGSAATSAFRPASPRRNSDSEKNLSGGATSSSSKHRMDSLDIDLNVIECEDVKAADVMSGKQVQAFRGRQSPESSLELSSRRPERLKLDLNRTSDDGDAPLSLDNRIDGRLFCNRNGHRSLSPASSSSSMQLSLRNIDLNDRPIALTDASDLGHQVVSFQNFNSHGAPKPVDPVISIMGTRVEVNKRGFIPPSSSLLNGKAIEIAMDTSVQRSGGVTGLGPPASYTHSPFLSHNGLTTGAISGSGGSIPYMVDSRGAAVVPQIVGSASAVPSYSQLPFIMSMSNTGLGLNVGPLRSSFDLNSGFVVDGANRDAMGRRLPAQARSMEEHLRANSQPSSSTVVGVKRKEPDTGWEHYPFNYRHQQFPWKQ